MTDKKNTSKSRSSLSHIEEEELMKRIERASKAVDRTGIAVSGEETESAWQTVAKKTDVHSERRTNFSLSGLHYAAAAVFLLFAIGLGYIFMPHTIKTEPGIIRTVELPDQTTVILAGNSTLTYPRLFGWTDRTVTLYGKAFFEVTTTGETFTVTTEDAQITVLGTAFSVRTGAVGESDKTVIYLKEGKVSFAPKNRQEQAVVLESGQLSWISEKHPLPLPPKKVNQSKMMNWLQKDLSFTNQSLSEIFEDLNKRYNVEFKVHSKQILQEKLTIYISNPEGVEQAVRDICSAKGYHFIRKNDTFIISK